MPSTIPKVWGGREREGEEEKWEEMQYIRFASWKYSESWSGAEREGSGVEGRLEIDRTSSNGMGADVTIEGRYAFALLP